MIEINDIIKHTGLKKSFIGRCVREISEIFKPFTQKGKNNRNLYDYNVLVIFDKIKQYKENGLSLPAIKKQILNSFSDFEKKPGEHLKNTSTTPENKIEKKNKKSSLNSHDIENKDVIHLHKKLHQIEIEKNEAIHRYEMLKNNLKLLPAGGDFIKLRSAVSMIAKLEAKTKAKFLEGRDVKKLWNELKRILFSEEMKNE
jgi:DNA-binding transcriptional MerR regulator